MDEVVGAEGAAEGAGADGVHRTRFQVDQDGPASVEDTNEVISLIRVNWSVSHFIQGWLDACFPRRK